MRITSPDGATTAAEQRVRWLRELMDVQVVQLQPITGVPALEPTPRKINCTAEFA